MGPRAQDAKRQVGTVPVTAAEACIWQVNERNYAPKRCFADRVGELGLLLRLTSVAKLVVCDEVSFRILHPARDP